MAKAKKLPSGNWRVQAAATVNGQRIVHSFTDRDRRRAELAASEWQSGIEREKAEGITLGRAYDRYIAAKENVLSVTTVRGYKSLREHSLQEIMDIKIGKLTTEQIQAAVNTYAANHSPKSVRNCAGLLSAVLSMFRPEFTLRLKLPQRVKPRLYIPTDDDIAVLLNAVRGTELEIPVLLGAFGALREGEICALTSDDVFDTYIQVNKSMAQNYKKEWIIKPPKTAAGDRVVNLPPFVMEKLRGKTGRIVNLTPIALASRFRRAINRLGLPHFRFHDLRHYNVSVLHAMGIPDKYIMAQGGWATNYTMNNVYNHVLKNERNEFDRRIAERFEKLNK